MEPVPPTVPAPPEAPAPPAQPVSLTARLFNVLAAPGEAFESLKGLPAKAANWLVPVLLASVLGIVASNLMFSEPAIQQQIREQQRKVLDKMVQDGKLPRAQADDALAK